jgi:hypothetical protein
MGSSSSRSRCVNFIDEFSDDYVKVLHVDAPFIHAQGLVIDELYHIVKYGLSLGTGAPVLMHVDCRDIIYNPEDDIEDSVEAVAQALNANESDIWDRFEKAKLT